MGSLLQNTIFGRQKLVPFVSTWNTANLSSGSSAANQVKLPLVSSATYNFYIDWGDGNINKITSWNQAETTHTYSVAGIYTITIKGVLGAWQFNNAGDRLKILSVTTWGPLKLSIGAFYGCSNLNLASVEDVINLSSTTSLWRTFESCTSLTSINRISEWNVANVISMGFMFKAATAFNQPLNNWNTANVTDLNAMFNGATAFNQPLNSWNVGNVTNLEAMFQDATAFNQPLNSWNTAKVTRTQYMFYNATAFNQDLGSWNVSKVVNYVLMFNGATNFNNGGSSSINNWMINTISTVDMQSMFNGATAFNQPLNNWNTANVVSMRLMFNGATAFNQPLNNWNTANVASMEKMFNGATAFNQDIGAWNVSKVQDFGSGFMVGKTPANFSTANLDSIFNGWSSRPVLANKTINFGSAKHTSASSAGRAILTGKPNNWSISTGGI